MTLLSDSERNDFFTTVTGAGFSVEDFKVTEFEDNSPTTEIYPITGKVSVRRIASGISREYLAGHATTWLATFDLELRGGVFGSP